jgi:hypothetical protein
MQRSAPPSNLSLFVALLVSAVGCGSASRPPGTLATAHASSSTDVVALANESDVRRVFSEANACPVERIEVTRAEREKGGRPVRAAPPEIANDPARLAIWQSRERTAMAAVERAEAAWSFFRAEGCGTRERYRCNEDFARAFAGRGEAKSRHALCMRDIAPPATPDDVDALFDCIPGGDACPAEPEGLARRRAAAAFPCSPDAITMRERPSAGLSVRGSQMVISARGHAEIQVQPNTKGTAYEVEGCSRKGIVACVPAHRLVVTATTTHDATETVCLWAVE